MEHLKDFRITGGSIGDLLGRRARELGDRPFLTFPMAPPNPGTDVTRTFRQLDERVNGLARGLAGLGIGAGSFSAAMLSNCVQLVENSFAVKRLGAVEVAIPPGYRGAALARMIGLTGASVLVTESTSVDAIVEVCDRTPELRTVVLTDCAAERVPADVGGLVFRAYEDVVSDDTGPLALPPVHPSSLASILFTSGSTGLSKGVMMTHSFQLLQADIHSYILGKGADDVTYGFYPLYNMGGTCTVLSALVHGSRGVLAPRFTASRFWSEVKRHGITMFTVQGTVGKILWDLPPGPHERHHRVRQIVGVPLTRAPEEFAERFNAEIVTEDLYGSSESGVFLPAAPGTDGRDRVLHQLEVADEYDQPLPTGEVGEILVRPKIPFGCFSGYFDDPGATAEKSRNLWYHTGDLGRFEPDGTLTFIGRTAEKIRSRGKNLSALEIESAIAPLPGVAAVAVVGRQNETGEDDIVAFVTLAPGASVSEEDVLAIAQANLPRIMWPEQVRVIETMPVTDTGKIAKHLLRERV